MIKPLAPLSLALCAGLAHAHEGHGLPGVFHWHAGDVLPLLGAAAAMLVGLWLSRDR